MLGPGKEPFSCFRSKNAQARNRVVQNRPGTIGWRTSISPDMLGVFKRASAWYTYPSIHGDGEASCQTGQRWEILNQSRNFISDVTAWAGTCEHNQNEHSNAVVVYRLRRDNSGEKSLADRREQDSPSSGPQGTSPSSPSQL